MRRRKSEGSARRKRNERNAEKLKRRELLARSGKGGREKNEKRRRAKT